MTRRRRLDQGKALNQLARDPGPTTPVSRPCRRPAPDDPLEAAWSAIRGVFIEALPRFYAHNRDSVKSDYALAGPSKGGG